MKRLLVHGLLHLAGMDHGRGKGGKMLALQERLLESLRVGKDLRGDTEVKMNARFAACAVLIALLALAGNRCLRRDARRAYLDGRRGQGREDYALAVEKYKEALSLNPAYLEPMVGLAESFLQMEEYDEASTYVAMARTYDRNNPDLAVLEGRIRIGQGDVPAARALFTGVLQSQPNNVEARLGMAEADIAEGRPQTALGQYARTLKLAPESTRAILSLAMLSDESGDPARPAPTTSSR